MESEPDGDIVGAFVLLPLLLRASTKTESLQTSINSLVIDSNVENTECLILLTLGFATLMYP